MTIIRKRDKAAADEGFSRYRENGEFHLIRLLDFVADSQVDGVFFHRTCVEDIFQYATEHLHENLSSVDEVGGFLLGKYSENPAGSYDVAVEHFCPARQVEARSPVLLKIGAQANAVLEEAMDERPGACLVGWFHTHPGHTPYLSETDLVRTHNLFYTKPYQLAVVLDPLTEDFDTGIFSRKPDGSMNNKGDFKKWIAWKSLCEIAGGDLR